MPPTPNLGEPLRDGTRARPRRRWDRLFKAFAISGLAAAGLIVAFPLLLFSGVGGGLCETTTYQEALSPNGNMIARVQMTDCGATTGFSRVVWVQPVATYGLPRPRCRALAVDNQPPVRLRWSLDGTLVIATPVPPAEFIAVADRCYSAPIQVEQTI